MVLVPQDFVSQQEQHQIVRTNPLVKRLSELDLEMNKILSLKDFSDDEKLKLYNQVLQRYLEFDTQRKEKHPIPVKVIPDVKANKMQDIEAKPSSTQKQTTIESEIIESVPKVSRNKAKLLVNKLRQNQDIVYWNDRGELLYDGKPVSGTNIVDLVRDVMGQRKNFQPKHGKLFSKGLARINTPSDWIGNENRKRSLLEFKGFNPDQMDDDAFEMSHANNESVSLSTSPKKKSSRRGRPAWIQY